MILREEYKNYYSSLCLSQFYVKVKRNERERERERNHREQIHPLENEKDEEEDSLTKTNFPPFKRVEFTIPLSHFDKILGHPRPLIQRNSKTPPPPFKSLH